MRSLLSEFSEAWRWLTGSGACANAQLEVERAKASMIDLKAQLERVSGPTSRRAA